MIKSFRLLLGDNCVNISQMQTLRAQRFFYKGLSDQCIIQTPQGLTLKLIYIYMSPWSASCVLEDEEFTCTKMYGSSHHISRDGEIERKLGITKL